MALPDDGYGMWRLIGSKEAAEILGCSQNYLGKLRHRGTGPQYHRLPYIRYRRVFLERWMDKMLWDTLERGGVS